MIGITSEDSFVPAKPMFHALAFWCQASAGSAAIWLDTLLLVHIIFDIGDIGRQAVLPSVRRLTGLGEDKPVLHKGDWA